MTAVMLRQATRVFCFLCLTGIILPVGAEPAANGLAGLEQRIRAGGIPNVHSLIIARHGRTVAEWYFEGADEKRGQPLGVVKFDAATLHDVRSVTKSIVSILFGIAQAQGAIGNLDTPVLDYFPEYPDLRTDERSRLTLRHLITMTSGLRWDEETYPYTDPRNSETGMDLAKDRLRYVLEQPIETAPGERFRYSGGDVALIGAIIARATGRTLEEFADMVLFEPMGITKWEWTRDDQGVPIAASGLRLLPRDMLKLGQLMLNNGRDGMRRIVPEDWAKAAVTPHNIVDPPTADDCGFHYGYFWWLVPDCAASPDPGWYAALGNGGNRIFVVPGRDLVIVVTAGLYNDPRQRAIRQITESVIAAFPDSKRLNQPGDRQ